MNVWEVMASYMQPPREGLDRRFRHNLRAAVITDTAEQAMQLVRDAHEHLEDLQFHSIIKRQHYDTLLIDPRIIRAMA